jgi:hypothetical protein
MSIHKELARIQKELKAPKNQFNSFGKYNYRSCEDILEGVKPLLNGCVLTLSDDVVAVGNRVYVKATVTISLGGESVSVSASAREAETKKGMDDSQITGTASSYARKYALNGLFCIDDTKDADTGINSPQQQNSDLDQQWVAAVKVDPEVLNQINDPVYREKIAKLAGA